jgi:hypothetical protein
MSLKAVLTDASTESYSYYTTTGNLEARTEQITVSWFSTEDGFESGKLALTSSNPFNLPSTLSSAPFLIAIARDDRGGMSYLQLNP